MPLERDVAGNNLYIVEHCKVALTNYWTINPAPADFLEQQFEKRNLNFVSPSQLGFLRAKDFSPDFSETMGSSITNTDIFYEGGDRIILVPDGAITKLTGLVNLVKAHKQRKEYVIPENQRDLVYAMVDEMLKSGIAFVAPHGLTEVQTSEFGKNDLTSRLFSDKGLGIEAQEYGDWLQSQGRNTNTFFMNEKNYSQAQKAPYLNRVRVCGPGFDFLVDGDYGSLYFNYFSAFGVRFEKTAEGGPKK